MGACVSTGPKCKDELCGRDSDENCGGYCEICWEKHKHKSPKHNDASSPTLVKSKDAGVTLDHTPSAAKREPVYGSAPGGAAPPQYELPAPSPMMATAPLPDHTAKHANPEPTNLSGIVPQLPQYNSQYPSQPSAHQSYPTTTNNPPPQNTNQNPMAPPAYASAQPNNMPPPSYGPPVGYQQQQQQQPPSQNRYQSPPAPQYPPQQQPQQYPQYPPQQQPMMMMQQPPQQQAPAANVRCPTCSAPLYLQPHQTSAKCPTCNTAFMRPGVQQPVMMTQPNVIYQPQPQVVVMQQRPVQRKFGDGLGLGMFAF